MEPVTTPELLSLAYAALDQEGPYVIGYQNLHGVYLYHKDPALREYRLAANLVYLDGMPLVLAGKMGGYEVSREHRTTSIDWMVELLSGFKERNVGVFFLGGTPEVSAAGVAQFRALVPGVKISFHHGYFDQTLGSADNEAVVEAIRASKAKVLFLGMGMPLQERWYLRHASQLDLKVVWAVGAVLDYFGGAVKTPPRWMGQMGLEWLFRLGSEPKRMYYRYLVEPWSLFPLLMKDWVKKPGRRKQAE